MERRCRVCGCTDDHACEGGCRWTEAELCSKCAELIEEEANEAEDNLTEAETVKEKTEEPESKEWLSGVERLLSEHSKFKGSGKELAIARPVLDTLIQFCKNERFSEAVRTSEGTFGECLKKVLQGVGNSISDLEVYQRAASYYFPNAKISFNMSIELNGMLQEASEKQDHKRVDINLDELF
jgi:hypothetical protein